MSTFSLTLGEQPPLVVLYEDKDLLAVHKPAGLLFHGYTKGLPMPLAEQVKLWIKDRYEKPGKVYCGIVHRLDRPVSGVSLFARHSKAASRLSQQFAERRVQKFYLAVTRPVTLAEESGRWDDLLPRMASSEDPEAEGEQHCFLDYRRLAHTPDGDLFLIQLGTGRRHQIRQQLSKRGASIWGDTLYGGPGFGPEPFDPRFQPLALHAACLTFEHPLRFEAQRVLAPLPEGWRFIPAPLLDAAQAWIARTGERKEIHVQL